MGLLRLRPQETEVQRSARRIYEKRWDKLLRKAQAQMDKKLAPEYVYKTIKEVYKISLDYVKEQNPKVYTYIKDLAEPVKEAPKVKKEKPVDPEPKMELPKEKNEALDELEAEEEVAKPAKKSK